MKQRDPVTARSMRLRHSLGPALLLAALVCAALMAPVLGAETRLPTSREEIRLSYAPLVRTVAPAVVNIYTKRVVKARRSPFFDDPFFRQFFGDNPFNFGVPRDRVQSSLGSGVIVRSEGVVVTNFHVIDKADQITVVLHDRRELEAEIVLTDKQTDLAVLRVRDPDGPLPFLKLRDSDDIEVGDLVLAIGNPFGVGQTVTSGIVSALARAAEGVSDFSFFIQTDAAINPGNSGGALVTMDGRLVGINSAIYSRSGGSMGIGFAIPSNMVARVIEGALQGARVVRPWFGAAGQSVTSDLAASLGLRRPVGALISEIHPQSAASQAGLRVGDVVLAVNGREVENARALRFRIATLPVGGTARLKVWRRGREITLRLPLRAAPEDPPRDVALLRGAHPLDGAQVANLSPALAEELSLDPMQQGVIVLGVARGSAAREIGVRPGDIVVGVNGREIDSVAALKQALARRTGRWALSVRREGKVLSVVIEG